MRWQNLLNLIKNTISASRSEVFQVPVQGQVRAEVSQVPVPAPDKAAAADRVLAAGKAFAADKVSEAGRAGTQDKVLPAGMAEALKAGLRLTVFVIPGVCLDKKIQNYYT